MNGTETARRWRALWVALAASVLLNAFFIGLIGVRCADQARGLDGRLPPGRAAQQRFARAVGHIDPEYQDQVRQKLAVQDAVVARESDAMTTLFAQMRAVLTAPRFDPARLDALHTQAGQHDRALKDGFSTTAKAIAQSLPDKDRVLYFQAAFPEQKSTSTGK